MYSLACLLAVVARFKFLTRSNCRGFSVRVYVGFEQHDIIPLMGRDVYWRLTVNEFHVVCFAAAANRRPRFVDAVPAADNG